MIKKIKSLDFRNAYKPSRFKLGTWVEWSLLALVLIVSFFIFLYVDYTNTIDNSVLFDKALFSGNFFNFYDYTIEHAGTTYAANYEFMAYIPFAIWNLPLAILNMATGFDYNHSTIALLWSKGFIVILAAVSIIVFYKILRKLNVEKEKSVLACFTLVTSVLFFWPVFMIVQIDIASVFLMLLGFYYYISNNNKMFILFFALSIPFKMFGLFLFIPLLLLKEKRVLHIILNVIVVCIPELICKILFRSSAAYNFALSSQSDAGTTSLLNYSSILGMHKISLFIAAFFGLCIFCYLYKPKDKTSDINKLLPSYIATLLWGIIMVFVDIRGYWLVYIAPFLMISIFTSKKFLKVSLIVETISSISYVLWNFSGSGNIAKESNFLWRLLLYKFVKQPATDVLKYKSMHGLLVNYGIDKYKYLFFTVFICSMIALMVLVCPYLFTKIKENGLIERSVILIRPLILIVFVGLYIFAYTAVGNPTIISFIDKDTNQSSKCDLLNNNSVSQNIEFDKNYSLSQLTVVFDNSDNYRNNFSSVSIKIKDTSNNKVIYSERVGCSMINSKEKTKIKLNKVKVNSKDEYQIEFSGVNGVNPDVSNKNSKISLYKTSKLVDAEHPAYENGVKKNYNLAFSIK